MIQLPPNFSSDIMTGATQLIGNFAPFIVMIGGVLLGMLAIGFVIDLLKK